MSFVHPSFLYFLIFALVPVILYFFNLQKAKKVAFPNLEMLEDIKRKTSRSFELKRFFIMLLRVLAVVFIVFVFAQPKLKQKEKVGYRHHVVFIDNSLSMTRKVDSDILLDRAKSFISSSIDAKKGDKFSFCTQNDWRINQDYFSKKEFIKAISSIDVSQSSMSSSQLSSLLRRKTSDLTKQYYLFSDFQASTFEQEELKNILKDTLSTLELNQLNTDNANVFIDSVWIENKYIVAGNTTRIFFNLVNRATTSNELLVRCRVEGNQIASKNIKIEPNKQIIEFLDIQIPVPGFNSVVLNLEGTKVDFDKDYNFVLEANKNIRILILKGNNQSYFEKAFLNEPLFIVKTFEENRLNSSQLSEYDLVVLDGLKDMKSVPNKQLKEFAINGGSILLVPSSTLAIHELNEFVKEIGLNASFLAQNSLEKEQLDFDDLEKKDWFKNEFLNSEKKIEGVWFKPVFKSINSFEAILKSKKGLNLLSSKDLSGGRFFLLTTPLDKSYTNLMDHAIFVVNGYELAMSCASINTNIAFAISDRNQVIRNINLNKSKQFSLVGNGKKYIPEQYNLGKDLVIKFSKNEEAGFYNLQAEDEVLSKLALNIDRKESDFRSLDLSSLNNSDNIEVKSLDAAQKHYLGTEETGGGKWKIWLFLALFCLLAETAIIRFYK